MMFRAVFWVVQVNNHFTQQYNPEDSSEQINNAYNAEYVFTGRKLDQIKI
jgi:hypothetical protein